MSSITEFIENHVQRGACTCGKCVDAVDNPESKQPEGHTCDLTFFKVATRDDPDKAEFEKLARDKFPQWFDGKEHSYIEVGGDLGDQGLALMCIGLGFLLGVWKALSPNIMMPFLPEALRQQMAGRGMVFLQATE